MLFVLNHFLPFLLVKRKIKFFVKPVYVKGSFYFSIDEAIYTDFIGLKHKYSISKKNTIFKHLPVGQKL